MLRNRHVITAMLVAPLLAILAWFAVGNLVGEKAAPARAGDAYPLVEKSNCRYESGSCDLQNTDLRVTLSYNDQGEGSLHLRASHELDSVLLSLALNGEEGAPMPMLAQGDDGLSWQLSLQRRPGPQQRFRVVLMRNGTAFFGEASTTFLQLNES